VGVYESQGASSGQASISPANSRSWEALEEVLRQFEARHRGIARYFDANTSWLSARLVRRDELGVMVVDERQFGDMTGAESEDDETDTEDEEHDDDNDDNDDNNNNTEEGMDRLKSLKDEKSRTPRPSEAARLRSASDVMNRIRWDPAMDAGDYLVGYEDRFSGLRERPLEQWKREQTDEEFIPQHRIQYFKRRSDATLVWERGARRDDIFGSGISARTTPPAVHEE
jgi:uncharacterized protein (UPF0248 family)